LLPKYRVWNKVTELRPVSLEGDVGRQVVLGAFWKSQQRET
jgi:hypothetical protein